MLGLRRDAQGLKEAWHLLPLPKLGGGRGGGRRLGRERRGGAVRAVWRGEGLVRRVGGVLEADVLRPFW